jgi:DNA-binding response OmpR family regulator
MRILVVDDDRAITNLLQETLSRERYSVDVAPDGEAGEVLAESIPYDLIVLDIMLPRKNGLEVCKSLRQKGIKAPILMLTAKATDADMITGLDCGADDYLTKPFRLSVLAAKIRALLRREPTTSRSKLQVGELVIDTVARAVFLRQNEVALTPKEYEILEYLAYDLSAAVSRADLEQHGWNLELDNTSNAVDEHIKNLRKKLGSEVKIDAIRGFGYRLSSAHSQANSIGKDKN